MALFSKLEDFWVLRWTVKRRRGRKKGGRRKRERERGTEGRREEGRGGSLDRDYIM